MRMRTRVWVAGLGIAAIAGLGVVALLQEREQGTAPVGVAGIGGGAAVREPESRVQCPGGLPEMSDQSDQSDLSERSAGTAAAPVADEAARHSPAPGQADPSDLSRKTAAGVTDRYADCAVLDERVGEPDAAGRYERVRVVRTNEKYPLVRVVERCERVISDPAVAPSASLGAMAGRQLSVISGGGGDTLLSQIAMAADHVTLQVKAGTTEAELAAVAQASGGSILRKLRVPGPGTYLVKLAAATVDTVPDAVAALSQPGGSVAVVQPDYVVYALETLPNDVRFGELWGMQNTGQTLAAAPREPKTGAAGCDIKATEAWDLGTGSRDVLVGVIDTGIDYTHEDLAANMWVNPGETGVDANGNDKRTNGMDDDGNGYVDDWHGWDFCNDDNNSMDDHYHGTHCAGTIGGVGNNGIGVAGVCWNVSLVGLKFLSASGSGMNSDAIEAIYYATSIGVKLTSNSWGGGGYATSINDPADFMRQAILDAGAHGILFVAAAGNSAWDNDDPNLTFFPCTYDCPNIIAVAATDANDQLAWFSCYGATTVDLGAPGYNIMSCKPGNSYQYLAGTSMACPHVAGAAALLASMVPDWSDVEIKAQLLANTDPIPAMAGRCITGGRLNIGQAMISPTPLARLGESTVSDAASGGNGDGVCNPGETVQVMVSVRNFSLTPLTNVNLTLTCADSYVTVANGAATVGNIPALANVQAQGTFTLTLASDCPTTHEVTLDVQIAADNGGPWNEQFRFKVHTSYQVSGTVTLDGAPVSGVTVEWTGPLSGSRVTDTSGNYMFGVLAGTNMVVARHDDWLAGTPIAVTAPPSESGVDFAFTTATVSGRVTDGLTGQPVAGVGIAYGDALSGAVTTAVDGAYSFTRVYGQPATLMVTASHAAYFDATNSVTVPPDAAGVDFALEYSEIDVDLTPIEVTATMGEVVNRTLTIGNQGLADLAWCINPPGREFRAVRLNEVSSMAFDGSALWTVRNPTGIGNLCKFDPLTGAWLGQVTVQDYTIDENGVVGGCGWNNGSWNGLDWDGASMWVAHTHGDGYSGDQKTVVVHAVNPTTGVIVKTLELNLPGINYVLGGMTLGDGCLWVLGGDWYNSNFRRVWKIDANTGAVLANWPLPAEIAWPFYSYVSVRTAHEIEYVNGALYVASTPYDVYETPPPEGSSRLYKLNPDTGQILDSFTIPGIEVYGLARAGTRNLWLFALHAEGTQGWTDAHLLELGDESWMRESPRSGTVAYLASQTVTLTLDTLRAGLGVHESVYRLASNDPDEPELEIPVRFTVLPNPTNRAPVITEGASVSVTMSEEGNPTPFALTLHAGDPDGDPLVWSVAAPAARGTALATGAGGSVAVTYQPTPDDFGADSFLVQVADNMGAAATIAVNVTIQNVNDAPTVNAVADPSAGIAPLTVHFTATVVDPDGDPLSYHWDFGDGQTSTLAQPVHTYTNVAVYAVTVTVTDPGGLSAQAASPVGVTDGTTRGQVYVWGWNGYGQLGNGTTANSFVPTPVPGLFGVTTAIAGSTHTTVQLADGNIYNMGNGENGQLGDGAFTTRLTPYPAPALAGGAKISANGWQTFVIGADGTVRGCGSNDGGQLGDGTSIDRGSPVSMLMADGTPVSNVTQFAANQNHSLFIKNDGTVWGCGYNGDGALGDGTWNTPRLHPVRAALKSGGTPLAGVVKAVAAPNWSLFLKGSDGSVWTCGRNSYYCLGNGDLFSEYQCVVVQVVLASGAPLTNVVTMDGGFRHGVALKADGTVWSWGDNSYGQLGSLAHGLKKAYAVQTPISNVTAIAASGYGTLALKADGTLWAWGDNRFGQIGDGTTTTCTSPVQVTGLSHVTAIEAGLLHCVALADASVNAVVTDVTSVTVPEGSTAGFRVKLREAPATDVTITVSRASGDGDLSVQSGASLVFTPANWDAWQAVTLKAVEDDLDPSDGTASFVCGAPGLNSCGVTAREEDNDAWLQVLAAPGGTTTQSDWLIVPKNTPFPIAAIPDAGNVFVKWTVLVGAATFGNANAATTTVTITAGEVGQYPGIPTTSIRADFATPGNRPPVITTTAWAGPTPTALPNGTTVHVAAGDPDGDSLAYAWSKVSGPGTATFGAPTAANGGVTFGAVGTYVLRVAVDDSRGGTATGEVTVQVMESPDSDVPPYISSCHFNAVNTEIVVRWQSAPGKTYALQAASNLADGFTLNLATNIPATPPENVYTDSVEGVGCRFYRVRVE